MSNNVPSIAEIRSFETSILLDAQKSNLMINVKKTMKDEKIDIAIRRAALHALRRIFTKFLDENKMTLTSDMKNLNEKTKHNINNSNEKDKNLKSKIIYIEWLHSQYHSYIKELCLWIKCDDPDMQEVAVATLMEFVSRECRLHRNINSSSSSSSKNLTFGLTTYRQLLKSFIDGKAHDADILLQMREQIFMQPDCTYYGLMIIRECMEDCKDELLAKGKEAASNVGFVQNIFDLLRMVVLPDEEDFEMDEEQKNYPAFFVNPKNTIEGDDDEDDEDDDSDNGNDNEDNNKFKKRKKNTTINNENDKKRKKTLSKSKSSSKTSKLLTMSAYNSSYSKAWLLLLSLPLTTTQHRLVLRHMPENVIPNLSNPILLADYLTRSYDIGGSIAVLALESLFILIVEHNLDYPKFFQSLYRLCTYEVFSAKYRSKFMILLHQSLQSTNLPAYTVAAFCRRLMSLALVVNAPSAMFLQSQCLWLLKRHTSCLKLVHDNESKESKNSSSNSDISHWNAEADDPAQANALAATSSLYETLLLERHYLPDAADLATSLRHSSTTRPNNVRAPQNESHADKIRTQTAENVQDYIGGIWNSYADVMDNQLAAAKVGQGAALSMKKPQTVIASDSLISGCFSGN